MKPELLLAHCSVKTSRETPDTQWGDGIGDIARESLASTSLPRPLYAPGV